MTKNVEKSPKGSEQDPLGGIVYENMKHGDLVPERIAREVADIAKIDDAISATEQEIAGPEIRAKAALGIELRPHHLLAPVSAGQMLSKEPSFAEAAEQS